MRFPQSQPRNHLSFWTCCNVAPMLLLSTQSSNRDVWMRSGSLHSWAFAQQWRRWRAHCPVHRPCKDCQSLHWMNVCRWAVFKSWCWDRQAAFCLIVTTCWLSFILFNFQSTQCGWSSVCFFRKDAGKWAMDHFLQNMNISTVNWCNILQHAARVWVETNPHAIPKHLG